MAGIQPGRTWATVRLDGDGFHVTLSGQATYKDEGRTVTGTLDVSDSPQAAVIRGMLDELLSLKADEVNRVTYEAAVASYAAARRKG